MVQIVEKGGEKVESLKGRPAAVPFIHSIFFKLLICFLLLSIVPLTLAGLLTYSNVSDLLTRKLNKDASSVLEQHSKVLTFYLNDLIRMGEISNTSPTVSDFLKNKDYDNYLRSFLPLDQVFTGIHVIRPENAGITLVNERGYVYTYGYSLNREHSGFYRFNWIPQLPPLSMEHRLTPLHDRPYSNQEPQEQVFSYVQQVFSRDLKAKGLLIIDFKRDVLASLFQSSSLSDSVPGETEIGLLITNRSGQLLYPQDTALFRPEELKNLNQAERITDLSGNVYRLVTRTNNETGLILTGYFQEDKLYEPIHRIRNSVYWIILPSIAFCLLVSFYLSHRISGPIRYLQYLMGKVGRGEFYSLFKLKRKDEIGQLGLGFNHMVGRIKELIQLVYEEQSKKRDAEVTALQSQINPHFLYNTLESINSLARKRKEPQISKMIVLLGKLLRASISTFDTMIPIWRELEYAACYLELHQIRLKKPIQYSIDIDEEIRSLFTVKWIIQPIVENAVLHGLDPIASEEISGRIEIKGWLEQDAVYLQVRDYGVGLDKTALKELRHNLEYHSEKLTKYGEKVGILNVQSRIRLHFGESYGLSVDSAPQQGMNVTIKLPRRFANENK